MGFDEWIKTINVSGTKEEILASFSLWVKNDSHLSDSSQKRLIEQATRIKEQMGRPQSNEDFIKALRDEYQACQTEKQPEIQVSPAKIDFPPVEIGQRSKPATVTLKNQGNDPLAIKSISLANSVHFSMDPAPYAKTLAPNSSNTFEVMFCPRSQGVQSTLLSVNSPDASVIPASISLTGTGTNLRVTVFRYDGKALSQAATVTLTGPETASKDTEDQGLCNFSLSPGTYIVTVTGKGQEDTWISTPVRVDITSDRLTSADMTLSPYTKVQCIGFNIQPGTEGPAGNEYYLGDTDAKRDIDKRCEILKKAIETAKDTGKVMTTPEVLKIFMAPEFFFRGAEGGYPEGNDFYIFDNMRQFTESDDYKDWLFIYGTAIIYFKHDDDGRTIKHEGHYHSGTIKHEQTIVDKDTASGTKLKIESPIGKKISDIPDLPWKVRLPADDDIKSCTADQKNSDQFWLTVDPVQKFGATHMEVLEPVIFITGDPDTSNRTIEVTSALCQRIGINTFWKAVQGRVSSDITQCTPMDAKQNKYSLTLKDVTGFEKGTLDLVELAGVIVNIDAPNSKVTVQSALCARILKGVTWTLCQGKLNAAISDCVDNTNGTHTLTLPSVTGFSTGPVEFIEPATTEIRNEALVQKGGPATIETSGSLKQTVVYKEYISLIDFLGPFFNSTDFYTVDGHKIDIHGIKDRIVLPTEGSRDMLSAVINVPGLNGITEVNRKGGGGCVFTIDGVTFGLEVCLDHAEARLYDFYHTYMCPECKKTYKAPGTCSMGHPGKPLDRISLGAPEVQVQLIPSWGMDIAGGPVCCLTGGIVFNVDGPTGPVGSEAIVNQAPQKSLPFATTVIDLTGIADWTSYFSKTLTPSISICTDIRPLPQAALVK